MTDVKRAHAEFRATLSEAALAKIQADATTMRLAATEFATVQSSRAPRMTSFTKELRNTKPLPPDCRLDAARVRNLDAAIDAVNEVIAR